MTENGVLMTGAWIVAIGTIVSAGADIRELESSSPINARKMAVGEALQAFGAMLIGTVPTDSMMEFYGTWIDGAGAATSSYSAYLQSIDPENSTRYSRIEVVGDTLQSLGASMGAIAAYEEGDPAFVGDTFQSVGAGLEAIGAVLEIKERERQGLLIGTVGAIFQMLGANLNAILITTEDSEEVYEEVEDIV
ncbi:DUF6944 family repetitive protein [Shouchella lonarensis]|uniref:Uncharacterized protein n=1 Tax=Shouchella lonarensis TaxID=1464122 RepID=A0A1G6GPQ6_9BACI|nr:hypothetical protein [Shouchella lonarensis]SDB83928.1 hypothetical protein SAMN05421737_101337 [Shouchella lonarensis]